MILVYPVTILTAGSNLFVSMPPQLARVAALRDLSIDNNVITTLPPLQPFFRLQHLSLCHNTLKTLPRSIGIDRYQLDQLLIHISIKGTWWH